MIRRLTAFGICTALCVGNALAAPAVSIEKEGRRVTVSEDLAANTQAVLMVVKNGEDIANNDAVYALKTALTDENGKAVWSFSMPEKDDSGALTDGKYDLYIKQDGESVRTPFGMTYSSVESRNRVKAELKTVTTAQELAQILDADENAFALIYMGAAIEEYAASDKDKVLKMVMDEIDDFSEADAEEAVKTLNIALAASGMTSENAGKYLEIANMDFEDKSYNKIDDSKLIEWLTEMLSGGSYTAVAELKNAYENANILYVINNSRMQYLEENLDKYKEKLGIANDGTYKSYCSVSNKKTVNKKITEALSKNNAKNTQQLLSVISSAVKGTDDSGSSGSSGSSKGGSKGSSSNIGTSSYNPSTPPPQINKPLYADMSQAAWAEEAVTKMTNAGIISGDGSGNFRPNDYMTREEFVKMLIVALGEVDKNAKCSFKDTAEQQWHYKYIASAYNKKIITGMNDELFGTGESLTRQDMVTLCKRAYEMKNGSLESNTENTLFADDESIADYAKDAVYALYAAGKINGMGDNTFSPLSPATRAQGAMIIYNLFLK